MTAGTGLKREVSANFNKKARIDFSHIHFQGGQYCNKDMEYGGYFSHALYIASRVSLTFFNFFAVVF
jgi:hypothetical protein